MQCKLAMAFAAIFIAAFFFPAFAMENDDVHLLVLAPFPDPQNPPAFGGGHSLVPAVLLAVDHINQHQDILLNHTLKLVIRDSGCEQLPKTALSYIPQLTSEHNRPIAVIGPSCSESSVYLAKMSRRDHFGIVQTVFGTTPELDNHSETPNTFGMIASTRLYAELLLNLAECNKWSSISILYDSRRYFMDTLNAIRETFKGHDVNISYTGNIIHSPITIPLTKASHQNQGTRIVVILASATTARLVACKVNTLNFTFPNYQLIYINRKIDEFLIDTDLSTNPPKDKAYICDRQKIKESLNKAILLRFSLSSPNESTVHISGKTVKQIKNEYSARIGDACSSSHNRAAPFHDDSDYNERLKEYCSLNSRVEENIFAYPYYDATWAIAMSFNNSLKELDKTLQPTENYRLQEEMSGLNFQGISTYVSFDNATGHVSNGIDVFQVESEEMNRITTYYRGSNECFHNSGAVFIRDVFPVHYERIDTYVFAIGTTTVTLTLFITFILHIAHTACRKFHKIKANSPLLNHFIFGGCYVMIFSVILNTIESMSSHHSSQINHLACNLSYYFSNLGYDLIFGTLCVKLWRLYSIFKHTFEKQRLLHNRVLVCFVIGIIGANAVLHLWMVKYNMNIKSILTEVRESNNGYIQVIRRTCQFDTIGYFFIPVTLHTALTLATLILCILNRNIKLKDFRNSRSTMVLVYLLTMMWTILGTLLIIYKHESASKDIGYLLYTAASTCTVFLCHALIILPVTLPAILQHKHRNINN